MKKMPHDILPKFICHYECPGMQIFHEHQKYIKLDRILPPKAGATNTLRVYNFTDIDQSSKNQSYCLMVKTLPYSELFCCE